MGDILVVAYHTGGPYRAHALGLRESLVECGLSESDDFEIDRMPSLGSWRLNAHIRPFHLLMKRLQHPHRPLLSLDADARMRLIRLHFFDSLPLDTDLAFHTHIQSNSGREEPLPGTLWLRPCGQVDVFLSRWAEANVDCPVRNDRVNFANTLEQAIRSIPLRTAGLGPEWTYIHDTFRELHPGVEPVIEHLQASRTLKEEVAA
ncbi:MAG: hypothetical protein R6V58_09965 [Planctomycetota bacterium]